MPLDPPRPRAEAPLVASKAMGSTQGLERFALHTWIAAIVATLLWILLN